MSSPTAKLTDEAEVVERAIAGEERAFTRLYDANVDGIYRFSLMRTSSRVTAEDLTSEVFKDDWLNLDSYQHRGHPFSSWLFQIAQRRMEELAATDDPQERAIILQGYRQTLGRLDVDGSAFMSSLRSNFGQTMQVELDFGLGDSGLSARVAGSAQADAGSESSQESQDPGQGSAKGRGEADASAGVEVVVDLSFLKKLWNRIRTRLEEMADRVQDKAEEIEFGASLQGEGSGSLETEAGETGFVSVESEGSGDASLPVDGEGSGEGFSLPILGGSLNVESGFQSETEADVFGQ